MQLAHATIWPAVAALPLAGCGGAGVTLAASVPRTPPTLGGPPDRLELRVARAGVRGNYETETFPDDGEPIVRVVSGASVSDDRMDTANTCLAGGEA